MGVMGDVSPSSVRKISRNLDNGIVLTVIELMGRSRALVEALNKRRMNLNRMKTAVRNKGMGYSV